MNLSDDFWGVLALVGVGVGAYIHGKKNGINETVVQYDTQALVKKQHDQIMLLSATLYEIRRKQEYTDSVRGNG